MPYLGNTPEQQAFTPAVDYFSGNGSTTAFTLSRPVASVAQVQVTVENVPQNPGTAYTVSGNTITFDGAPPSGTNNIYVYYTSPITQVIQPGQGTVNTTQIVDNAITTAKIAPGAVIPADLSTGAPFWDTSGNVGIGTTSPASIASGYGSLTVNGTNGGGLVFQQNGTSRGFVYVDNSGLQYAAPSTNPQVWYTNGVERMRLTSGGDLQFNSGYGSVATAYGCRAWVNFNGTGTVAIRASGNVSSITDNGTGDYTVNFTTAMPDANYSVGHAFQIPSWADYTMNLNNMNTGSLQVVFGRNTTPNAVDIPVVAVSIFR